MEPRDLKSCGCGKHRGGLRALADPLMSVPLLGICGQALPSQVCGGRPKPDLVGGELGNSSCPHPLCTHSGYNFQDQLPFALGVGWEGNSVASLWDPSATPIPFPFPWQSGAGRSCDRCVPGKD